MEDLELNDNLDNMEDIVEPIDIEAINDEALRLAVSMVKNLSTVYFDEQFMEENPTLKKRIDSELENLRILFKMRSSDEQTHDILLYAITSSPKNASLYHSLTKIQGALLSIQKQIDDTINNINKMLKGYQLEMNFNKEQSESMSGSNSTIHRGSKTFIEEMRERNKIMSETMGVQQMDLFTEQIVS